MVTIVIDGLNFKDLNGFYSEAELLLTGKQTGMGHSLSGFEDLLRGGFGLHSAGEALSILWMNASVSKKVLGYEAQQQHIAALMEKCHTSNKEALQKKMEEACRHIGPTLFDTVCELIEDSDDTGHNCTLHIFD